jgi:hypothetical protein
MLHSRKIFNNKSGLYCLNQIRYIPSPRILSVTAKSVNVITCSLTYVKGFGFFSVYYGITSISLKVISSHYR